MQFVLVYLVGSDLYQVYMCLGLCIMLDLIRHGLIRLDLVRSRCNLIGYHLVLFILVGYDVIWLSFVGTGVIWLGLWWSGVTVWTSPSGPCVF